MQLHKEGALLSDDHSYYGALIKEKVVLYKLLGIRRSVPRLTYYVSHWQLSSFILMENELVDQLSQKKTLSWVSNPESKWKGLHLSWVPSPSSLGLSITKFEKSSFVLDFLNTVQKVHGMQILLNSMSCASRSLPAGYSPGMILMLNDFEQLPRQRSTTS